MGHGHRGKLIGVPATGAPPGRHRRRRAARVARRPLLVLLALVNRGATAASGGGVVVACAPTVTSLLALSISAAAVYLGRRLGVSIHAPAPHAVVRTGMPPSESETGSESERQAEQRASEKGGGSSSRSGCTLHVIVPQGASRGKRWGREVGTWARGEASENAMLASGTHRFVVGPPSPSAPVNTDSEIWASFTLPPTPRESVRARELSLGAAPCGREPRGAADSTRPSEDRAKKQQREVQVCDRRGGGRRPRRRPR